MSGNRETIPFAPDSIEVSYQALQDRLEGLMGRKFPKELVEVFGLDNPDLHWHHDLVRSVRNDKITFAGTHDTRYDNLNQTSVVVQVNDYENQESKDLEPWSVQITGVVPDSNGTSRIVSVGYSAFDGIIDSIVVVLKSSEVSYPYFFDYHHIIMAAGSTNPFEPGSGICITRQMTLAAYPDSEPLIVARGHDSTGKHHLWLGGTIPSELRTHPIKDPVDPNKLRLSVGADVTTFRKEDTGSRVLPFTITVPSHLAA